MSLMRALSVGLFFSIWIFFHLTFTNRKWISSASRYPVDTDRKLNVHKTFRRRPGSLLKVLCTFNLRPVSIG